MANVRVQSSVSTVEVPAWVPVVYPNTTTAFGTVTIEGEPVSRALVGAFVDGECRGVQDIVMKDNSAYLTMLINGNESEDVYFGIFDFDSGYIYESDQIYISDPGSFIGWPPNLLEINGVP